MMKDSKLILTGAQRVNFREIRMGGIAPGILYRSSHPIKDNKQEDIIAFLAAQARIAAVINLADTDSEISTKSLVAPWYHQLYENNRVIGLGMSLYMCGSNFWEKLKKALLFIINTEGPWLIHCHAGFDRTGFVAMILESLMGATRTEIINDYLLSQNSLFVSSTRSSDNSLVAIALLLEMQGSLPLEDQNLPIIAEQYLRNLVELSTDEVNLLKVRLSGKIR